jgi:hypothetical protein
MKYFFILLLFTACKTKPAMQNDAVKIHAFRLKPGQDLTSRKAAKAMDILKL